MAGYAMAQDVIVKKDGSTIISRVIEITQAEVKYKRFSNLNGPTYTILKSEVQVINYENGEKETFEEEAKDDPVPSTEKTAEKGSIQNVPQQDFSYEQLATMGALAQGQSKTESMINKAKKLKVIGWIGGGVLAAAGVACLITGAVQSGSDDYNSQYSNDYIVPLEIGAGCVAAGAVWATAFLVRAHNLKKRSVMSASCMPLYQYDLKFNNGSSLAAGVDVLRDGRFHDQALGLGLRYNF